ncbi:hypothetical protein MVEG_12180 [Podila verticillata NRRL 6337]|uniref:Uncharacterized protein n=1 Tax=Podila verticillata NRRL 6337 TaxID=1069443 RepID=A0A086TJ99_9FUNG|nr:hypothetical protein MVEG_12180 [Podila verticillata NRRL 6337]
MSSRMNDVFTIDPTTRLLSLRPDLRNNRQFMKVWRQRPFTFAPDVIRAMAVPLMAEGDDLNQRILSTPIRLPTKTTGMATWFNGPDSGRPSFLTRPGLSGGEDFTGKSQPASFEPDSGTTNIGHSHRYALSANTHLRTKTTSFSYARSNDRSGSRFSASTQTNSSGRMMSSALGYHSCPTWSTFANDITALPTSSSSVRYSGSGECIVLLSSTTLLSLEVAEVNVAQHNLNTLINQNNYRQQKRIRA